MSIKNLDKIFKPKSLAVIGDNEKEEETGITLIRNIIDGGYKGDIYPVNIKDPQLKDRKIYRSLWDIKQPIDLAVITAPIKKVPSIMKQCVDRNISGAMIISTGGKFILTIHEGVEQRIRQEAEKGDVRIIGPNCMGVIAAEVGLNISFMPSKLSCGNVAFISQSGTIGTAILDLSRQKGIGFRYFVSTGTMLDVDFGDLISYMGNDDQVDSIILFVENLTNIKKFMSAARAISRAKPIIALKAGRSGSASQAVLAHTGFIASEDNVYDAAFKRAGIVRVDTIEELFDCTELIAKQSIPSDSSLTIVTNGGGMGVMAADVLSSHGLKPALLKEETVNKLNRILSTDWQQGNPIDILNDASPKRWQQTLEVCFNAEEINGLMIIFSPQKLVQASVVANVITDILEKYPKHQPVYTIFMGGKMIEEARQILDRSGIPNYETPERAVSAFMHMRSYAQNMEMMLEIPPKFEKTLLRDQPSAHAIIKKALKENHTILTEKESKSLLDAYGIPVNRTEMAKTPDEAVFLVNEIGFPVLMKIHSRDISPEMEVIRVQLNQGEEKDIQSSFTEIMKRAKARSPEARLAGVTIQPILREPKYELMLGSRTDPQFGPVILFGSGGRMTEVTNDQAIALPPLNRLLARRLMESTRIYQMLQNDGAKTAKDLAFLEEILVRFSRMLADFSEIKEIDINPMILIGDCAYAFETRIIIGPSVSSTAQHLVISPYPNQYEAFVTTEEGVELFIRPIKPEDAHLLVDLFNSMSPESVYFRFFMHLKSLTPKMLVSLTQIDYDNDMALVAFDRNDSERKILGVARFMVKPGEIEPGFAVTVGDPWQGKRIGQTLMKQLLDIAKEREIPSMWGVVLSENFNMLNLVKEMGGELKRSVEVDGYDVRINLNSLYNKEDDASHFKKIKKIIQRNEHPIAQDRL